MEKKENTWLDRVIEEKKELGERISKLEIFLSSDSEIATSDNVQYSLLTIQLQVMEVYYNILAERVRFANLENQ